MDKSQLAPINERESKVFNNTTITLDKIHRQAENNPILPILAQLRVGHKTRFNEIDEYLYTYSRAEDFIKASIPYFVHSIKGQQVPGRIPESAF